MVQARRGNSRLGWFGDRGCLRRPELADYERRSECPRSALRDNREGRGVRFRPCLLRCGLLGLVRRCRDLRGCARPHHGVCGHDAFGVGDTLTRGQLATILWRNACPDEYASYDPKTAKNEIDIAGSADGMYYTAAANWAFANGVITGIVREDGTRDFAADGEVSFEQLVTVLARLCATDGELDSAAATCPPSPTATWRATGRATPSRGLPKRGSSRAMIAHWQVSCTW